MVVYSHGSMRVYSEVSPAVFNGICSQEYRTATLQCSNHFGCFQMELFLLPCPPNGRSSK